MIITLGWLKMDYESLGLKIINEFITVEEEQAILDSIENKEKRKTNKGKGRNSIRRYGSDKPYKGNIISKSIPDFLVNVSEKLVSSNLIEEMPDSVSINEYLTGQEISYHIDSKESGKVISVLSLMNKATMLFRKKKEIIRVELPPRCLTQLRGEIRNHWEHAISPVTNTRYSIVFRCSEKG